MSTVELPPLPESGYDVWDDYYEGWTVTANGPYERYDCMKLWNEEQMTAYASQAVDAALEAAALVCDERVTDCVADNASDGDERWLVYAKHARRLAAAIRAMKEKP